VPLPSSKSVTPQYAIFELFHNESKDFLGVMNLGDIHRVIGLVGECERGLLRDFPEKDPVM
jgi:hypothetical protein